jgi:hypothetical protein
VLAHFGQLLFVDNNHPECWERGRLVRTACVARPSTLFSNTKNYSRGALNADGPSALPNKGSRITRLLRKPVP